MNTQVKEYLAQAAIGEAQVYKNLVMYPLISPYDDGVDYLLLDEALEQGVVQVTEVSKDGSVPDLKVRNRSAKLVLILDGEELVGAKQNRIVNATILLAPESETLIPVSCVERGRWNYKSDSFASEKRMSPSAMRMNKCAQVRESVMARQSFSANQGEIWREISERQSRRGVHSHTDAMSDLYHSERPKLDEYIGKFKPALGQVGAVFMINGRVAGMDCFGRDKTLDKIFSRLVESYAVDALDLYDPSREPAGSKADLEGFVQNCREDQAEENPSVAMGVDCRVENDRVLGAALVYDNHLLHLSAFNMAGRGASERLQRTRLSSMSQRMRHRS